MDDGLGVGEIVENEIGTGGFQGGAGVAVGGHGDGMGVDGFRACDVVRGVADDVDIGRLEIGAVRIAGAISCERAEAVAIVGIVGECAEREMIPNAVMAELEFGAAAEVASEEANGDIWKACEGVEDLREAGKEPAIMAGQLDIEVTEVGVEEALDIIGAWLDTAGLKDLLRDPDVGLSGEFDVTEILIGAKGVADGLGHGLLAGTAGGQDGAIDVEEDEFGLQI